MGAGAVLSRPACTAKPPDSDSDFRLGFRKSDFRPRTPTSDPELGSLRLRVRSPVREGTRALEGSPPASFLQVERTQASPPSAQSIEHARHAIEQRLARHAIEQRLARL